jgi:hypothetical protein
VGELVSMVSYFCVLPTPEILAITDFMFSRKYPIFCTHSPPPRLEITSGLLRRTGNPFFVLWYWGLNSGSHACQADPLSLEPLHQPFFVLGIFNIGSCELFTLAGFET